jgi:hypothetical protein
VVVIFSSAPTVEGGLRTYTSVLVRWGGRVVGKAVAVDLIESSSVLDVVEYLTN